MKKALKPRIIAGIVIAILLLLGGVLWMLPHWKPVKVTFDIFTPYHYTVFEDYVELNEYKGKKPEVVIPGSLWGRPVTVIGDSCFDNDHQENDYDFLTKVTIPDSVEIIKKEAFYRCKNLETIEGGGQVREIGVHSFTGCKELKDVGELGESVEKISSQAFVECTSLTCFLMTERLAYIGAYAFVFSGLEQVNEVSSVRYIGEGAFYNTPWLQSHTEEYVLYNQIVISYQGTGEKAVLPEGIKAFSISEYDWEENRNLKEIYVPKSTEIIYRSNLYGCRNVKVYIPKEVEFIGFGEEDVNRNEEGKIVSVKESAEQGYITDVGDGNIIVTTAGSPAEAYAKKFGIPCEIVEGW